MRMEKRKFRIGELAQKVGVEQFVIRFWEKEFSIKPLRSPGGQRFYQEKELQKFTTIKELLYEKKFTIAGAKLVLQEKPEKSQIIPSKRTKFDDQITPARLDAQHDLRKKLLKLRPQLIKLKELL